MADEISAWYHRRTRNCSFLIRSLMPSLHHLHFSLPCNTSIYGERKERISHRARIILSIRLTRLFSRSRSSNDSTMDRQFFFFLFHSSIHSSIQKSIFIDSQLNSSVHQKKKKFPLLGRVMILQTFWDIHCAWLRTTRSSSSCHCHSSPLFFFFFFGHLCLFDVRVSSNHVAFDSWN